SQILFPRMATTVLTSSVAKTKVELEQNHNVGERKVNGITDRSQPAERYELKIVWINATLLTLLHLAGIYGFYLMFTAAKWQTNVWSLVTILIGGFGVTAGVHRLWTHKSYKATLPLKIFLMAAYCTNFQNSMYDWIRDHRMHHKYTDTDADPHNVRRGFFFSHVGWLAVRKHKDLIEKGKTIWMKDLEEDPIIMFQKRHITILSILGTLIIPVTVPWLFWNESLFYATIIAAGRYTFMLNTTWCINSVAHIYGGKPYDRQMEAGDLPSLSVIALGEAYQNYHHAFPWDYKTSEHSSYGTNLTNLFLDLMAMMGWAYDLKTVSTDHIRQRMSRTGDQSKSSELTQEPYVWGWDDDAMTEEDKQCTTRSFRKDE
ncbi:hypothetical protein AMK59_974, partial [Oryctes borbonicus]